MSVYGHVFRSLLFPAYESALRGRKTLAYRSELERNQWLPREQVLALQFARLQALLRHCHANVPYYREQWKGLGIVPDDIRSLADYARLPVLTKSDIREHFDRLLAPSLRPNLLYKTTGGSTGEPLRLAYTRENYERRIACMFRGYGWTGAQPGQRTLYLWGANGAQSRVQAWKDRIQHAAFNRRMLNVFAMRDDNLATYVDAIDEYAPETIVAYVSPAVTIAAWARANGRAFHRAKRIITGAEALHEGQRQVIEDAFGCPVYNSYGCREVMLIASECEARDGLHVNADQLLVELVPQAPEAGAATADSAATGDVVVTDLSNYGMPFIRYANGDMATPGPDGDCACGRGLPRLRRIDGRKLDIIRTRDGHALPGEFFPHTFKDIVGIRAFQVRQTRLDALDVTVVPGEGYGAHVEAEIRGGIEAAIGTGTRVQVHVADSIALTPSGKRRVTISELG